MGQRKEIKSAKINGKTIQIEWEEIPDSVRYENGKKRRSKVYAEVDSPRTKEPVMTLNPEQNDKNLLESTIHECLHLLNWRKSEQKVDKSAKEITSILWRIGFRI